MKRIRILLYAALINMICLLGWAQSVYGQIEAQSSFETQSVGTFFGDSKWSAEGFNVEWNNGFSSRGEVSSEEAKSGNKSLKVTYPKDKYGTSGTGGQAFLNLPGKSEYYLSYWVKFDANFSWGGKSQGGKLPGLGATDICSGGDNCTGSNGFTSRYMWRSGGRAVVYLYHMDKPKSNGEDFQLKYSNGSNVYFPKDEWIHLVQRVKLNTVSSGNANYDGELQVWMNDTEVLDESGLRFVDNSDQIDVLYFSTFHGGDDKNWAPSHDSYTYFDDVLVTTEFDDIWANTDTDNDGVPDQIDGCPTDKDKTVEGLCGCFVEEGTCLDCNGDPEGTAYMDICGNCVEGLTGLKECIDGNIHIDEFDDLTVNLTGTSIAKVVASETECGEVKIENSSLGNYDPIYLKLPKFTDLSFNPRVTVRVRSTAPLNLRMDLRDSAGAVTNGSNGRVTRAVAGDPMLWEELTFDYSDAAFTDNGANKTQIESVAIMFDPGSPGFEGEVYFDYIAFGDPLYENNSTCIDGNGQLDCHGDPNGTAYIDACEECVGGNTGKADCEAQTLYEEQFDDLLLSLSGTSLAKMDVRETQCGEVRLENISLGNYDPIYMILDAPIDMSNVNQVVVRARASHSVNLRLDLRDINGMSTNQGNGRISESITADSLAWREYTFTYPEAAFTDMSMDRSQIERIAFMFDAGSPGFAGTIYLDFVALGDPSGNGNATELCNPGGKPMDCNGVEGGSAYLDECAVCVGGNTNKTPCVVDCHGDENGNAEVDACGVCSGGNTGIPVDDCQSCDVARDQDRQTAGPLNTKDGNGLTTWTGSEKGDFLEYCLDTESEIVSVSIAFEEGDSRVYTFDILTSLDGITWNYNVVNGTSSGSSSDLEMFTVLGENAKKVRIVNKGNTTNDVMIVSEVVLNTIVGNYKAQLNAITVFPNPASETVIIRADGMEVSTVVLLDQMGRVLDCDIHSYETEFRMNVTDLAKGLYMIQLQTDSGIHYLKQLLVE